MCFLSLKQACKTQGEQGCTGCEVLALHQHACSVLKQSQHFTSSTATLWLPVGTSPNTHTEFMNQLGQCISANGLDSAVLCCERCAAVVPARASPGSAVRVWQVGVQHHTAAATATL
jgi:hypothetical protein